MTTLASSKFTSSKTIRFYIHSNHILFVDNTDVREITRNQFRQQTQSGDGGDVNSVVASTIQSLLSMIRSKEDSSHQAMHKKFAATSFLYAILNEYSSSTRASDFGLPW